MVEARGELAGDTALPNRCHQCQRSTRPSDQTTLRTRQSPVRCLAYLLPFRNTRNPCWKSTHRMKPCIPGRASSFTSPPLSSACSSRSASNRPSSTSTIGTRLRNWSNRFTTSSKATCEPTQRISGDNPRQRNKKERPCVGPFGAPSVPINRPLGGGCVQLPIPRHDHRVDDVDDAVRCSDITLPDVRSIDLHVRRGHHYRQRTTLNGHHVT